MSNSIYSGTKAFAVRGSILHFSELTDFAYSDSLDAFVSRLNRTPYGDFISELERPYDAARIQLLLQRRLAKVARSMITATSNSKIMQAYYSKLLSNNVKIILKGFALDKTPEEIATFVDLYAEELVGTREIVARVISSGRLDEAVSVLRSTQFGEAAEASVKAFLQTKRTQVIDPFIDRAYFKMLSSALLAESVNKRGLRELVALDVDTFNVMCVLRAREWGMSPADAEQLIIEPQFKISRDILVALARSASSAESLSQISRTPYQGAIGQHDEASPALGWIEQLDSGFESLKFRAARRTFTWDIFGTSKALGILKLLEYEIRALSGIAFGIGQRMPAKGIIKDLSWFRAE